MRRRRKQHGVEDVVELLAASEKGEIEGKEIEPGTPQELTPLVLTDADF